MFVHSTFPFATGRSVKKGSDTWVFQWPCGTASRASESSRVPDCHAHAHGGDLLAGWPPSKAAHRRALHVLLCWECQLLCGRLQALRCGKLALCLEPVLVSAAAFSSSRTALRPRTARRQFPASQSRWALRWTSPSLTISGGVRRGHRGGDDGGGEQRGPQKQRVMRESALAFGRIRSGAARCADETRVPSGVITAAHWKRSAEGLDDACGRVVELAALREGAPAPSLRSLTNAAKGDRDGCKSPGRGQDRQRAFVPDLWSARIRKKGQRTRLDMAVPLFHCVAQWSGWRLRPRRNS